MVSEGLAGLERPSEARAAGKGSMRQHPDPHWPFCTFAPPEHAPSPSHSAAATLEPSLFGDPSLREARFPARHHPSSWAWLSAVVPPPRSSRKVFVWSFHFYV